MDRSPLDTYLAGIKETADTDPKVLHERSLVLARSLKIKVDEQCFDKLTEEQAPCLMRNPDQLVLDDGHSQSMVAVLTSGPGGDLVDDECQQHCRRRSLQSLRCIGSRCRPNDGELSHGGISIHSGTGTAKAR
jgi:hypothetical protein